MNDMLLSFKKKTREHVNACVDADYDESFHWSTLQNEGSVKEHGLVAVLTAIIGRSKPTLTCMDPIDND